MTCNLRIVDCRNRCAGWCIEAQRSVQRRPFALFDRCGPIPGAYYATRKEAQLAKEKILASGVKNFGPHAIKY